MVSPLSSLRLGLPLISVPYFFGKAYSPQLLFILRFLCDAVGALPLVLQLAPLLGEKGGARQRGRGRQGGAGGGGRRPEGETGQKDNEKRVTRRPRERETERATGRKAKLIVVNCVGIPSIQRRTDTSRCYPSPTPREVLDFLPWDHQRSRKSISSTAPSPTPRGASRLVQAMFVWSVKTRCASSRHCRGARSMVIPLRLSLSLSHLTDRPVPTLKAIR